MVRKQKLCELFQNENALIWVVDRRRHWGDVSVGPWLCSDEASL